jgi:phosphatidylserine decarboxylase
MGGEPKPLPVWDRRAGKLFNEFMDDHPATYDSKPHRSLTQWLESQPLFDWGLALYQNTRRSAREIEPFIKKHGIDMGEFKPVIYRSFAEFFDREFRLGVRSFPSAAHEMGAFAEARYFAWEKLEERQQFPIKGHSLSPEQILGDSERARPFLGGPVILARLAPVDYHRVHYPVSGRTVSHDRIGGRLWTINWRALLNQPDILFRNERVIDIWQTENFGRIGFAEIGAMSVGRVLQIHPLDIPFERGFQKSMFKFGGSAIVLFGEPGKWRPSDDLLQRTREGVETLVRLGEVIAVASSAT